MRDFASCYNEHAVKVSDSSCSGTGNGAATSAARDPSVQRSVTCFYRTKLMSGTRGGVVYLVIRVTWSDNLVGQGFSLGVEDDLRSRPQQHYYAPHQKPVHDDGTGAATSISLQLRKKKGSRSCVSGDSVVEVYWDISSARYDDVGSPEPVGGFYVAVVVDGELGLRLGDMNISVVAVVNKRGAEFSMIGRREQVVGSSVYSTRSRLGDGGRDHEIQIQCRGDQGRDARESSELCVCVDKKKVVHVRRLLWNFRGNQTIFVDGVAVDVMWDVHDWWFSGAPGCAAFMFRARGALAPNRLWLEEEETAAPSKHEQQGGGRSSGFSLLIHAFKTPWQ